MNLQYKPDFERARRYFDAFWQREVLDRPLVSINAPKDGVSPVANTVFVSTALEARGDDDKIQHMLESFESYLASRSFLGEAIPFLPLDFGPDMFASFFGATLYPSPGANTTWAKPCVTDWSAFEGGIDKSPGSTYADYLHMLEIATAYSQNKFLISCPDCHSNLDTLSALCGPQQLCYDLIDYPDALDIAMKFVRRAYRPLFEDVWRTGDMDARGTIGWIPTYSSGRFGAVECDAACLVGPDMFRRYVLPALEEECAVHDHVCFHLDGKEALVHLDDILSMDAIDIIQWVPGAGQPRTLEWMDLLHRIQAAGKGLWLYDWTPEEIKAHFRELRPEGVFFTVETASEAEGEELLDYLVQHM